MGAVMKVCPRCESMRAWRLADGRLKCQSCGRRYLWKSVWDSVRLTENAKQALLDAFVRGVPAAQCTTEHACTDSRERFYRLVRACCAQYEGVAREGFCLIDGRPCVPGVRPALRGWLKSRGVLVISFVERATSIQIAAPASTVVTVLRLLQERVGVGGVIRLDDARAYACLNIQGEYVIVPPATHAALGRHPAELFWHYARTHLHAFRKILIKFFPLYLAEACLRFNQRDQDLGALLRQVMTVTSIGALKPLLRGEVRGIGPDPAGSMPISRDRLRQSHWAAS